MQGLRKLIDQSNRSSSAEWKKNPIHLTQFDTENFKNLKPKHLAERKAPQFCQCDRQIKNAQVTHK